MMRSLAYTRTTPEAREGLLVFVVFFAVVIMGPATYGRGGAASTGQVSP
jgi:hypothetical protein